MICKKWQMTTTTTHYCIFPDSQVARLLWYTNAWQHTVTNNTEYVIHGSQMDWRQILMYLLHYYAIDVSFYTGELFHCWVLTMLEVDSVKWHDLHPTYILPFSCVWFLAEQLTTGVRIAPFSQLVVNWLDSVGYEAYHRLKALADVRLEYYCIYLFIEAFKAPVEVSPLPGECVLQIP